MIRVGRRVLTDRAEIERIVRSCVDVGRSIGRDEYAGRPVNVDEMVASLVDLYAHGKVS